MISQNGVLIGQFKNPQAILANIPRAKYIRFKGKDLVLVPHKLDETLVLRNLGINAPSPILSQYSWPGRYTPMKHQYTTAEFLTLNKRCFCLNEMRTGKTSSAIWAADYLLSIGAIDEVLVICPVSVMGVWFREVFNTAPHRPITVLSGSRPKRIRLLKEDTPFKVINFDGLVSIKKEAVEHFKNKRVLIIADEAATYRTYGTDRYKALRELITAQTWLWMLTGTPTPNAPTDAWALAKLVNPRAVPASYKLFQETVMKQVGPYKWVPKTGSELLAFNALQPAIRFLRKECLDIPKLSIIDRAVDISAEQAKVYDNLKRKMRHEDSEEGPGITAANAAVRLLKLQQVFCGIVKDDNGFGVELDNAARLDLTRELIEENGGKAIVFVPFKLSMAQLKEYLSQWWRVGVVNGDVSKGKRDEIFDGFQLYNTVDVLIAHPGTTAHGLDLSASNTIIWYAPTFSLELYEQANARIQGPKQTESCAIFHIGCHPLEWSIYEVVNKKQTISSALLSLYGQFVDAA